MGVSAFNVAQPSPKRAAGAVEKPPMETESVCRVQVGGARRWHSQLAERLGLRAHKRRAGGPGRCMAHCCEHRMLHDSVRPTCHAMHRWWRGQHCHCGAASETRVGLQRTQGASPRRSVAMGCSNWCAAWTCAQGEDDRTESGESRAFEPQCL